MPVTAGGANSRAERLNPQLAGRVPRDGQPEEWVPPRVRRVHLASTIRRSRMWSIVWNRMGPRPSSSSHICSSSGSRSSPPLEWNHVQTTRCTRWPQRSSLQIKCGSSRGGRFVRSAGSVQRCERQIGVAQYSALLGRRSSTQNQLAQDPVRHLGPAGLHPLQPLTGLGAGRARAAIDPATAALDRREHGQPRPAQRD